MVAVALYFVAFTIQIIAIIGITTSSSWEVATLFRLGFVPTPAWTSFFCLLALCFLSMVIPFVQLMFYGCRCFPDENRSREDRHLTISQYQSQAIFLGIQTLLWLLASGYSTAVLVISSSTDQFGYVTYIGIAASWTTTLFTLLMMILVIHIRRSQKRTADYLREFRLKADVKEKVDI